MQGLRLGAPILLSLLLLSACLNGGGQRTAGSQPSAPVIEPATKTEAAQTPTGKRESAQQLQDTGSKDQDAGEEQSGYTAVPLTGLTNKAIESAEITGSWVGLFGMHDVGAIERTWENGQRVDFLPDGQAIWSKLENGVVTGTMDSQWTQDGAQLELSFKTDAAVRSGLAAVAPLGVNPMAAGATGGEGSSSETQFNPMQSYLDVTIYPSFLVLIDKYNRMMVYGRLSQESPGVGAQGLAGDWTASINGQPDGVLRLGFSRGGMVTYDWKEGEFGGNYVSGYFVGPLKQGDIVSYAVAASNEFTGGHIHGIICVGPYYKAHEPFEFIR